MPIAGYKPGTQPQTKPNLPKVVPKTYKTNIVVDSPETPVKSLMAYMEGAPWAVDFFSQVVKEHNDIREIDLASTSVYQQYQRITKFEIRVGSSLTDSYDPATGITTVSGNATMVNVVVPNKLDYFISDTGDNRTGIFRITNVERKTFNLDSVFYIEYDLAGFVDTVDGKKIHDALIEKTIRTYTFSKDRLVENLPPLVREEDSQQVLNLKNAYHGIVRYYFKTFFNKNYMTLVLPGQEVSIYDSYLVNYLLKIVDTFDADEIRKIRISGTDNEKYLNQYQFWEMMLNREYQNIDETNQKMGLVAKTSFIRGSSLHGVAFSNFDYLVYPMEADTSMDVLGDDPMKPQSIESVVATKNFKNEMLGNIARQYVTSTTTYQLFPDVLADDYYVLTGDFYLNTSNQTVLEILTKDYLKGNTINLDMLYALVNSYHKWSRLEQFYYGPILLTLIKEADRSTYS